jgi:ABC-2 type transport system ATP-binding protein
MSHSLRIDGVVKRFSGHTAVDGLSLAVPVGSIYGILGPNGAGKSTTIRMVMNIIARDAGTIDLLGTDPAADPRVLQRVGFLPEERGLYRKMKAIDVIVFFGRLKGMATKDARREGERWLERLGLTDWRDARVETLSKGMQQKVQFVTTVMHAPDLLILDEPTSGLDPVNQEVLRDTILGARDEGRTVIFSTHNMAQAEEICDSVCIIAEGRKVLDGSLRDIRRAHAGRRYQVEFETRTATAEATVERGFWFEGVDRTDEGWEVELSSGATTREAVEALNAVDSPLVRFSRVEPTLHEIFVTLVGDARNVHRRPEVAHA